MPSSSAPIRETWEYGKLRPGKSWIAWCVLAVGISAMPIAWLVRDSVAIGRNPLPAWSVLLVGAVIAITGVALGFTFLRARSREPKLITLAEGKLDVPGGILTGRRRSLLLSETSVREMDLGFVKQLQLSSRGTRVTLSSSLFTDDSEFDRLVTALNHQGEISGAARR